MTKARCGEGPVCGRAMDDVRCATLEVRGSSTAHCGGQYNTHTNSTSSTVNYETASCRVVEYPLRVPRNQVAPTHPHIIQQHHTSPSAVRERGGFGRHMCLFTYTCIPHSTSCTTRYFILNFLSSLTSSSYIGLSCISMYIFISSYISSILIYYVYH